MIKHMRWRQVLASAAALSAGCTHVYAILTNVWLQKDSEAMDKSFIFVSIFVKLHQGP